MAKTTITAIITVFLFAGAAYAGCPADMSGQHVAISGIVAKQLHNPHLTHWTGEWSLRVNANKGPCAGVVVIRTAKLPSCHPGQEVSVSGKVVRDAWFGNNTSIRPVGEVSCKYPAPEGVAVVKRSSMRTIRTVDAAR